MKPIIVLGGGGHARVLLEALCAAGVSVLGFTVAEPDTGPSHIGGVPCLGTDEVLAHYLPSEIELVNGVGGAGDTAARIRVYKRFVDLGFQFATVIHPSAVVASSVEIGRGVQVMAGAVVQPGARIGDNAIVNTRASVDHDCDVGPHAHIAPGVTLCGGVRVGLGSHIGAGATVIQNVCIGQWCLVGAGALVLRDVPDGRKVYGVPAKEVDA
ncbi:pilus assembly protein [Alicyclobacillus cellulosilyticus]|uniref:Pilus assembly protein n=1 Tax=Alicyclobacillus cellulosilyticus TaxID=1003997 RepID=A0A917KGX5_9BACL|nr:acetyltransferase [Alicyclobacillus cellulosilyticus]GGJ11273.1 pilus assembly protein [Alicyclobacillus cellulosilyticus]